MPQSRAYYRAIAMLFAPNLHAFSRAYLLILSTKQCTCTQSPLQKRRRF